MSGRSFVGNDVRILMPTHQEAVLAYAKERLIKEQGESVETEMQTWSARWRGEALEHYLKLGWSFGRFGQGDNAGDGDKLLGFILAQPYLFHRGLTQTLWVETLEGDSPEIQKQLLETAYAWARDKHFQCVLIEDTPANKEAAAAFAPRSHPTEPVLELRSARF